MKSLKNKEQIRLLKLIAADLKAAIGSAHAASKTAHLEITSGRIDVCLKSMLEIEPKLYDAKKLFVLATYVNGLGKHEKNK